MTYTDSDTVFTLIKAYLSEKKPLSLIRLGDGEIGLLNAYNDPDNARRLQNRQYGVQLSWEDVGRVRKNLILAIQGADMLGLPFGKERHGGYWARWEEILDRDVLGWRDKEKCHIDVHNKFLDKGCFKELLHDLPTLNYISCRDLNKGFERGGVVDVRGHIIPGEAAFTGKSKILHYPKGYINAENWILKDAHRSGLAFVGAGFTGKIYCNWLRDLGCVAIDCGNVLDLWAGQSTRGPVRGADNTFKL